MMKLSEEARNIFYIVEPGLKKILHGNPLTMKYETAFGPMTKAELHYAIEEVLEEIRLQYAKEV